MTEQLSQPTVTVIVPTYRRSTYLKRAIKCIQKQTYSNLKIYISDDCSGDDTQQIVLEIAKDDSRVHYHCNENNLGPHGNYSDAMSKIDTPFFAFCADDDIYLPNHIEYAINEFKTFPEAGIAINEAILMDKNGWVPNVVSHEMTQGLYRESNLIMHLVQKEPSFTHGGVFRKEVIDKIGYLKDECGSLWDWDFCFKAAAQFPFAISKKPGTINEIHCENYFLSDMSRYQWDHWKKFLNNCIENVYLDKTTRKAVETHLRNKLRTMIKNQGRKSILNKDYEQGELCKQILQEFFNSTRYRLKLGLLAKACKYLPPIRWYLNFMEDLRFKKKIYNSKVKFIDYQQYKKLLNF
jgi:glycosyltransferase involved in cell wall biosynthesis